MHELRLPSRYRRDASQKLLWFLENYDRKDYAERWAVALKETEDAIAANPLAFPQIREVVDFDYPLREAWFGVGKKRTHRVIFAFAIQISSRSPCGTHLNKTSNQKNSRKHHAT